MSEDQSLDTPFEEINQDDSTINAIQPTESITESIVPISESIVPISDFAVPTPQGEPKRLPKGYAYEPVKEKVPDGMDLSEGRSGRRARPQINYAEIASPKPPRMDTSSRKRSTPSKSVTKPAAASPVEDCAQVLETIQAQLNFLEPTEQPKKRARTASRPARNVRPPPKINQLKSAVPSQVMRQCTRIIKKLMNHRHSGPFLQPVDPVLLCIPDYFTIIQHPMDFGTIHQRLVESKYPNPDEFHDDVRLVFENCRTYNAADSDVVRMANILESEVFEPEWSKFPQWRASQSAKAQAFDLQQKLSELTSTMLAVQEQMRSLTQSSRKPASPSTPSPASRGSRAAATSKPKVIKRRRAQAMSFEEKRWLSEQIGSLDTEPLIHVVKIIHEAHPLVQNNDAAAPDVIEIDIDSLDTAALRKLMAYVKKTTGRVPPNSRHGRTPNPNPNAFHSQSEPAQSSYSHDTLEASSLPAFSDPIPDDFQIGITNYAHDDNDAFSSETDSDTDESDADE